MTEIPRQTAWIVIGRNGAGHCEIVESFDSPNEADQRSGALRNERGDLKIEIEELETAIPDRTLPTGAQRKELGEVLHRALVAIRSLAYSKEPEMIAELADMFHNLPVEMFDEKSWDWNYLEISLERFHRKYPDATPFDFAGMISNIRAATEGDGTS